MNASSDLEQLERQYHPSSFPSPCPSSPGPPARSPSCSSCLTTEEDNTGKETDDEDTTMGDTTAKETDEDTDTEVDEDTHSVLGKVQGCYSCLSFFDFSFCVSLVMLIQQQFLKKILG